MSEPDDLGHVTVTTTANGGQRITVTHCSMGAARSALVAQLERAGALV